MSEVTVRTLAKLVGTPVEKLLEQLAEAGMSFSGPDQLVTPTEKMKLLGFLRRTHGKSETAAEEAAPRQITLKRRKVQELTVAASSASCWRRDSSSLRNASSRSASTGEASSTTLRLT